MTRPAVLILAIAPLLFAGCQPRPELATAPARTFVNPVYEGADPFVYKHTDGVYYFCQSEGDQGIAIWKSDRLTDKGVKRVVWTVPEEGWNTAEVWAPEIHYLHGKWYIYYAADSGENKDHRMGVLESVGEDAQGAYIDKGMLYTGDDILGGTNNRWAIDGTPLEMNDRLYFIWSGWEGEADEQWLYIAEMDNPWTVSSNRVKLAENDEYLWERVSESPDERGLNEAPQVLRHEDTVYLIYSVSGSWQPSYKLAQLSILAHADPMDPSNWMKRDTPVFTGSDRVHGVGHAFFTTSPDGSEDWIIYHTKIDTLPGWRRVVHIQPFGWRDGALDARDPVPAGVPLPVPSGEPAPQPGRTFSDGFDDGTWDRWVYYGYNRFIDVRDGTLSLTAFPGEGMANNFPSGEKALVRGYEWDDVILTSRLKITEGNGEAGLLIRATHPAVGYHALKGYYAALRPAESAVVLGFFDGRSWSELARVDMTIDKDAWYEMSLRAAGSQIEVLIDGELELSVEDGTYGSGMVGVRSADVHALFDDVDARRLRAR